MKVYVLVETTYYKNTQLTNQTIIGVYKNELKAIEARHQAEDVEELLNDENSNGHSYYHIERRKVIE